MTDFSIELASERIFDSKTKEYFKEVLSSYINGNYRSAIVMLWTVVICDLVYKLQQMRDLYGDMTAEKILEDIEKIQQNNPKSPEWEEKLLVMVKERTALIEYAEHAQLVQLHTQRHLSAHPILDQTLTLYSPNKETTRALIRNTLESVLLKPPILTKKIIDTFVQDIAEKKDLLPDIISLERYIYATYLRNLKPEVENDLFKVLWKFAFQISNPETDANREINIRILQILYRRRPSELRKYIREQADTFSRLESSLISGKLVKFLSESPYIFRELNDTAKTLIENAVEKNINLTTSADFLSESIEDHLRGIIKKLKQNIDSDWGDLHLHAESWNKVIEFINNVEFSLQIEGISATIGMYCVSPSYNYADHRFDNAIIPLVDLFTKEHFIKIFEGIEINRQLYERRRATQDHTLLKSKCDDKFGDDFDYSNYPILLSTIQSGSSSK